MTSETEQRTTDERYVEAAYKAVEGFVNAQRCQSKDDVMAALRALATMAGQALNVVAFFGKSEKLS